MAGISANVTAMVQATIQAESGPLTLMQQQQANLSDQASALNTIMSQLTALQTAVNNLSNLNSDLDATSVTSSNGNVATATATSTATQTSHTLTVANLAVTSSAYSDSVSGGASATLNDGTLSFTVNGTAQNVSISAANGNNTLTSLASNINSNSSSLGVKASVITDSTGSKLVLVSNTAGAAGSISAVSYSASGSGNTSLTFGSGSSNIVAGQDASYTLDNIPLSSTTNSISGVLAGVTFSLQGAGTTTLSISPDTDTASNAISSFVDAYNTVVQSINSQFAYDASTGKSGPLGSDSSLQLVQQSLLRDATYAVSGSNYSMSSLGITTNEDGTLKFDKNTFSSSLTADPTGVLNFFQEFSPTFGFAQNFANDLVSLTSPINGPLAVDLNGITQQQSDLTQQINDFQDNLNAQQQMLIQQYGQANATLLEMPTTLNSITSQLGSLG
jgi:flagellar hook-associated protein 2